MNNKKSIDDQIKQDLEDRLWDLYLLEDIFPGTHKEEINSIEESLNINNITANIELVPKN
jgi:hypothetical protein